MHHIAPLGPLILLLLGYFTSAVTVYLSLAVFILMSSHTLANAMPVSFVLQNSIFLGLEGPIFPSIWLDIIIINIRSAVFMWYTPTKMLEKIHSCLVHSQFWTVVGIFSHPLSVEQSCSNLFGCFSCILKEINVNCFKQQTLPSSPPCGFQTLTKT